MHERVAAPLGALLYGLDAVTTPAATIGAATAARSRPRREIMGAAARKAAGEWMRNLWADRRKQKAGRA